MADEAGLKSLDACSLWSWMRSTRFSMMTSGANRCTVCSMIICRERGRRFRDGVRRRAPAPARRFTKKKVGDATVQYYRRSEACRRSNIPRALPEAGGALSGFETVFKGVKTATVVFFDEKRLTLLPKIASTLKHDDLGRRVERADDLESRSSAFEAFVEARSMCY